MAVHRAPGVHRELRHRALALARRRGPGLARWHPRRGPRRRAPGALPHPSASKGAPRRWRPPGRNVRGARLEREVSIAEADATRPLPLEGLDHGLLVTNPPYGDRLTQGGQKGMKTFYFHLGERLGALPGFRMAVLSGNPAFEARSTAGRCAGAPLWNGPIECTLLGYPPRGLCLDARLAPAQEPPDVSPVGPEHRPEEHRGQRRRDGRGARDEPGHGDGDDAREQRAHRADPEDGEHRRPGQRACQRRPGCEHRQDAEGGRDALPTAKPEPGRRRRARGRRRAPRGRAPPRSRPRRAPGARGGLPSRRPGRAPAPRASSRPPSPRWWPRCCRCPVRGRPSPASHGRGAARTECSPR